MAKPIMVKTPLDLQIAEWAGQTEHQVLAAWACDCAERVLPHFETEFPDDPRPRQAIKTGREWVETGIFKMAVIRGASLGSHAAARETEAGSAARSAARAAGQAVAAAHVPAHAIAAAIYAATAIRDASAAAEAGPAALREREWQLRHLQELGERSRGQ